MADAARVLADTHVVAWYALTPERLSDLARLTIVKETDEGRLVIASAYSVIELIYMQESGKISVTELEAVLDLLHSNDGPFVVVPITADIATGVQHVPRRFQSRDGSTMHNSDPGDRVLVATARDLGLTLLSKDDKLQELGALEDDLEVVW